MIEFMQDFMTVVAFMIVVFGIIALFIIAGLETYDAITGADKKRQEQLEKLRRYELEDEDL